MGLKDLLHRDDVRLITLTGAPGIGKTRLALGAALELQDEFEDGACLVDLSPLRDPGLVLHAVARALGVREVGADALINRLVRSLRGRHLLLILDNFEHLVPAASSVAELLSGCAELRVLTTSRAPLRLQWEHQFPVQPLAIPDLDDLPPYDALDRYSAVALFVARAQAVKPNFTLTSHNARPVAEVCSRLDGLPLAIELAAAHISMLPPEAMLQRLCRHPTRLAAREVDRPPRHHSLEDCVAWSYALLGASEQVLLRRLSVFSGGCTPDAAEAVCWIDRQSGTDALDGLRSLVDKSLVVHDHRESLEPRFRMLVTIREFAHDRLLQSGKADVVQRRHAEYYLALAEEAEPKLWESDQVMWLGRLEAEIDNLRAALAWCTGPEGDLRLGIRLGAALRRFWDMSDHLSEGREWSNHLLALITEPSAMRWNVLLAAYFLALIQGDYRAARKAIEQALSVAQQLNYGSGIAFSYVGMGTITYVDGDLDRAVGLLEEAVRRSEQTGENRAWYIALYWLADIALAQGRLADAAKLLARALEMSRAQGDIWMVGHVQAKLGHVEAKQGDFARALSAFQESLDVGRRLAEVMIIGVSLEGFAWIASAQGCGERAARLIGASEGLRERIGGMLLPEWRADHDWGAATARSQIGDDAFTLAWADGHAMSLERAVEYAADAKPAASAFEGLTHREQEVAALVARGLTNREIAAALIITEGTAANHVQHILNKLGFNTRAQVAAWATEHGLLATQHRRTP